MKRVAWTLISAPPVNLRFPHRRSAKDEMARFCVNCGLPVSMLCPYEKTSDADSTRLMLRNAQGMAPSACTSPDCGGLLKFCPRCGRLHRLQDPACLTTKCAESPKPPTLQEASLPYAHRAGRAGGYTCRRLPGPLHAPDAPRDCHAASWGRGSTRLSLRPARHGFRAQPDHVSLEWTAMAETASAPAAQFHAGRARPGPDPRRWLCFRSDYRGLVCGRAGHGRDKEAKRGLLPAASQAGKLVGAREKGRVRGTSPLS